MFDRVQAERHLQAIAPHGGRVFIGTKTKARAFDLPAELDKALDHAGRIVERARCCYVTPALTQPGNRDRLQDRARCSWLAWCDVDKGWHGTQQAALERLRARFGHANVFRIRTSAGRFHVYVMLAEPVDPPAVKELNRRLVAVFDGDRAPTHAAAWMRLAGTVHAKDAENVQPVCFVDGWPNDKAGPPWADVNELTELLAGIAPTFSPPKPIANYTGRPAPAWAETAIDAIVAEVGELQVNDRHEGLYRLACRSARICNAGHGQDWDAVSERLEAASTIPADRRNAEREYDEVWRTLDDAEKATAGQTAGPARSADIVGDPATCLAIWNL